MTSLASSILNGMARRIKTTPVRKKHIPLASLASLPVFAQDPTDEAAAKIDEKFGGNQKAF